MGAWERPGQGYTPKYKSTVWAVIALGQLGASVAEDARVARACDYVLAHTLTVVDRQGGARGQDRVATIDCLQGNMLAAVLALGCDYPDLAGAVEWAARSITGDGIAPAGDKAAALRYGSANVGPDFQCAYNSGLPCAWGAIKLLAALALWPADRRTPLVQRAIDQGAAFLLGTDPAQAAYPADNKPSPRWWQFGYPLYYPADLLQNVEALVDLGYGQDPRLAGALAVVRQKADASGRWPLDYRYYGREWIDLGRKGQPNKWITLRALRTLKRAG